MKTTNLESRGWVLDTVSCIEKIKENEFSLNQIYAFENDLKLIHPENNCIKDKLRQQLQCLRDKGFIEFLGNGQYKKLINNLFMNEYLLYTFEGFTQSTSGVDVENVQILGFEKAQNKENALQILLCNNTWIQDVGFDTNQIVCRKIG